MCDLVGLIQEIVRVLVIKMSDEESAAKKQELSSDENQDKEKEHLLTVTGRATQQATPDIFKLNAHCCDEIFKYLPLEDLHSLGETCRTMQLWTGAFFKRIYSSRSTNPPIYVLFN